MIIIFCIILITPGESFLVTKFPLHKYHFSKQLWQHIVKPTLILVDVWQLHSKLPFFERRQMALYCFRLPLQLKKSPCTTVKILFPNYATHRSDALFISHLHGLFFAIKLRLRRTLARNAILYFPDPFYMGGMLRYWRTGGERGHIVADTLLLLMMFFGLHKLGNICCGHKMFLNKIRNILFAPDTKFVSATNVARTGKRGNICVGNNVSATMCPRLPGPLYGWE